MILHLPFPARRNHRHRWRRAKHLVDYSPSSYRWCRCGTLQLLTFDGWRTRIRLTSERSRV